MPLPRRRDNRSFVLVIVLGMIVLIVILVIGFLGHVAARSKSSSSYRDQTGTLLLGDVAVNIVKAQIDTAIATTTNTSSGTPPGPGVWASQPGAIRTVSSTGSQITYKLYSSTVLTNATTGLSLRANIMGDLPTSADPNDWSSSALWTDLNAPAIKSDGTYAYPIIDVYNDNGDLPAGTTGVTNFATGSFNIDSTPANNPFGASRSATATSPLPSNAPLPMPVRWLYVLKQGQVIVPDSTSTATSLTFNNASTKPVSTPNNPATDNPIIGRIAFWTDDDTCRVNVNTASFGTFWDTPRFTSTDDLSLATNQPVNKEYQRYPGHAAMTTLSLALPEFASTPEALIGLTPRYYTGGSTEGTVASTQNSTALGNPAKLNRLYASVDELLFDPPPTASGVRTASSYLLKKQVETAKFFLTAHSRAPELNLYGEPRVAIWPISSLTNTTTGSYRTATDQLIGFCSSIPGTNSVGASVTNTYYFTRAPHTLLVNGEYTTGLTGSNSSTTDVDIARNVSLLTYLDSLTSVNLPGNLSGTATFDSKYTPSPTGMRQILTEIFDYIRITNTRDPLLDPYTGNAYPPANIVYANVPYAAPENIPPVGGTNQSFADGQILPTLILPTNAAPNLNWGTYGYGRFGGVLTEATLVFIGVGKGVTNSATPLVPGYPLGGATTNALSNCYPVPQAQCATEYNNTNGNAYGSAVSPPYTNSLYPTNNYSSYPSSTFANYPYNTYPAALTIKTNNPTPSGFAPIGGVPPQSQTAVQAVFSLTFFDPALGFAESIPECTVTVTGLNSLTLNGNNMGFTSTGTIALQGNPAYDGRPSNTGSTKPFPNCLASTVFGNGNIWANAGYAVPAYQVFSNILNVPSSGSGPTMTLGGGGSITVTVYPLRTQYTADSPIHTYTLNLADINASLPVPGLSTRPLFGSIRTIPSPRLTTWPPTATGWSGSTPPTGVQPYPDRFDSWDLGTDDSNGESIGNVIDSFDDTVVSLVPSAAYSDYRMLAATNTPSPAFVALPGYPGNLSSTSRLAYGLEFPGGQRGRGSVQGTFYANAVYYPGTTNGSASVVPPLNPGPMSAVPLVPVTVSSPTAGSGTGVSGGPPPDFDNGFGPTPDGPYINKPDEGIIFALSSGYRPYYDSINMGENTNFQSFVSPERQVPSPVMFGSLPTGAPLNGTSTTTSATTPPKPWQTLLFQPGGGTGAAAHAGLAAPKDEYLLDLFWMPQAEPYAISEPFSTAGKVNLNYQIFPFLYIDRSTAIQSVLASEKVAVVGYSQADVYKHQSDTTGSSAIATTALRSALNLSEVNGTLSQFVQRFSNLDFFHTAAEICDVYLVPQGYSWPSDGGTSAPYTDSTAQAAFYNTSSTSAFSLVGDNTREKPYADIYSRITTKSNSFTVYYRVQTLKNPPTANAAAWTEGQGAIVGDFRGSTTLERYIDPNDTSIPDYTSSPTSANLENHYKWRVVENTRFSP